MRAATIFVLVCAIALVAAELRPLRVLEGKRNVQDACDGNPCGSSETCCIVSGGQAGCCPDPNACCCPDQAHCCAQGQCTCSGQCPGSGCTCTSCASSGQCENSSSMNF